ncbi:MAG: M42 family peptidase [Phycisphaeraceae bacterium]|nr:MAG: M42 family peptidase [Phycisphaeraceae bacterium]
MNIDLLKRLCETPGVPGREERVRTVIEKEVKGLFDEVYTDPMGSLVCRREPRGGKGEGKKKGAGKEATRVVLLCHMDEIGFYVRHIDDNGFVRVQNAGGFDTRNLFARRVKVCTRKHGDLSGAMNPGGRPIHIATDEDKKKIPEIKEFMIDMGMSGDEVRKRVTVGDMVVLDEPFLEMGGKFVSKALDNRAACWAGVESVRAIDKAGTAHACQINVVFTVQEEVGLRGARTSAHAIRPHIAIGVDTTLACDTPGVPDDEAVSRHGQGAVLGVMDGSMIADHTLVDELEAAAKKNKIATQRSILPRGGQDGGAAQLAAEGCRAAAVLLGVRNIHTVTEMVDQKDAKAYVDLLAAWLPTVS